MPDTPDPVASAPDRISAEFRTFGASDEDTRRLLKAAEAALKLVDDWTVEANRIVGIFASDEDPRLRTVGGMEAEAFEKCARGLAEGLGEAITAALAGGRLTVSGALKQGIRAQMEKHSQVEPQWNWAVVFDTAWHPVQPPGGSEWDYDMFITRSAAEEQLRQPLTDRFRDPELWQRRNGIWEEVTGEH